MQQRLLERRLESRFGSAAFAHGTAYHAVAQIQRRRILHAMVEVVAEHGFTGATVKLVTTRAGVSSRTFYQCFDGLQECFVAVLDEGAQPVIELIRRAFDGQETWLDGVRSALGALLAFLDSEPLLARVWLVESLAAGSWALRLRERKMGEVLSAIVAPWLVTGAASIPPLALEGSFASVLGLVVRHLVADSAEPLIELLGPLMGLAVAPFLDEREVAREIERGAQLAHALQAGESRFEATRVPDRTIVWGTDSDETLPGVRHAPRAGRAWECLLFLAEQGGRGSHPSNREIAVAMGVTHHSQISKLLAHLAEKGFATKRSEGPGKRNAWQLTARGEQVARALVKPSA